MQLDPARPACNRPSRGSSTLWETHAGCESCAYLFDRPQCKRRTRELFLGNFSSAYRSQLVYSDKIGWVSTNFSNAFPIPSRSASPSAMNTDTFLCATFLPFRVFPAYCPRFNTNQRIPVLIPHWREWSRFSTFASWRPRSRERPFSTSSAPIVIAKRPPNVPRDKLDQLIVASVPTYQKIPGLLRKFFTVNDESYGGMYLWADRTAAEAWFTPTWAAQVKERTGADPQVIYFDSPVQIDNRASRE